jgi:NAD(P)-dependent dehydrogenase (short-subunit alcohol dehydrogenase family)
MSAAPNLSRDGLVVVTGGAGFIGSNIVVDLAEAGSRVVVSDLLRSGGKWRNIARAHLHDVVRPDMLFEWLGRHGSKVAAIVHMGAVSSTAETDVDRFVANNIRLTLDLWEWCSCERHVLYLRVVRRDLWRRQRGLQRRPEPGCSCRTASAQCLWVEQARLRSPHHR